MEIWNYLREIFWNLVVDILTRSGRGFTRRRQLFATSQSRVVFCHGPTRGQFTPLMTLGQKDCTVISLYIYRHK